MYDSLLHSLRIVSDPRIERQKLYPLDYILLIVFVSTMSGCDSWYEIEDYAEDWSGELKSIYRELTGDTTDYGMPAHDTLNRAISLLEPQSFEEAYRSWLSSFLSTEEERYLCLDGKTMLGVKKLSFEHHSHVVSDYSLKDMASVDAIGTQADITETIIHKGGDYVLCVKNNQKHSLQEIESLFSPMFQRYIERLEQTELSHGRIEARVYELIAHPLELEANTILEPWAGLKAVLRVYRKRVDKKSGSTSEETSYYISSLTDLERLKTAIRSHWAIENRLHHCLEVYLEQDASHKTRGNAPQIMDMILKINLFILMHLKTKLGTSLPRLQKQLSRKTPLQIVKLKF